MIEIALCLAIIGFALVAIIGVLPTGLSVQKDNREETIINYEANFLMDAIRNGSQGQDDLTNYVLVITNRVYQYVISGNSSNLQNANPLVNWYTRTNYSYNGSSHQVPFLTNGANIIGVLSTPKYVHQDNTHFISNAITADFRAITGPATDQGTDPSSIDFAFRYRVNVEIVPYGDNFTGYDPSWVAYQAPGLSANDAAWRATNYFLYENLKPNFNFIRLRFRWPVLPNGKTGTGNQVFRTAAGGWPQPVQLTVGRAPAPVGYFIQPGTYICTNSPAYQP
jgi:type II secretory pathway pseudopilin PulG